MSKFIKSNNTDDIKHTKQIININNEAEEKIFSIDEEDQNFFYQIELKLISGRGNVILQEEEKYIYELDYEYHPYISVIIKLSKYNISSQNLDPKQNFTFFINVTKLGEGYNEITTQFDYAKNYRIKYYLNKGENIDIFPLNLKINCKRGYTIFASYRLIKQENYKRPDNSTLYNTGDYDFYAEPTKSIDKDLLSFESKFYHDFQRGVIKVNPKENYDENYIEFFLNKKKDNKNEYKYLDLDISIVYVKNDGNGIINIPRNSYVQFDLNKNNENNLEFVETNSEYFYSKIEIANTTEINITNNFEECDLEKKYGKRTYICKRNSTNNTFTLKSNKPFTALIKYTTRQNKEDFPIFNISNATIIPIIKDQNEEGNNNETKVILSYPQIDGNNAKDKNISYFVRLYDYLQFFNDTDVDSILIDINSNKSFRRDCDKSHICEYHLNYTANFGYIKRLTYFISVIGEVTFNGSAEYLSYEPIQFRLDNTEDYKFEQKWIIPLVLILLIFCVIVSYGIYKNIKEYKEKKAKNKENKADILINDGDKEKSMTDMKEEEKDEDKDKEDDEDEDDASESFIKV